MQTLLEGFDQGNPTVESWTNNFVLIWLWLIQIQNPYQGSSSKPD